MSLLMKRNTYLRGFCNEPTRILCALLFLSTLARSTFAQDSSIQHDHAVTALVDLLQEAGVSLP